MLFIGLPPETEWSGDTEFSLFRAVWGQKCAAPCFGMAKWNMTNKLNFNYLFLIHVYWVTPLCLLHTYTHTHTHRRRHIIIELFYLLFMNHPCVYLPIKNTLILREMIPICTFSGFTKSGKWLQYYILLIEDVNVT